MASSAGSQVLLILLNDTQVHPRVSAPFPQHDLYPSAARGFGPVGFLCSPETQAMQTEAEDGGERKHCSTCDIALREMKGQIL